MKITLMTVGKLKESYLREAAAEYIKRLSRFCDISVAEVADENLPDGASDAQCLQIKDREGAKLLKASSSRAYHIALAIDGSRYTSEGFAEKIEKLALEGKSSIEFFIGGSIGLSDELISYCDMKLSFSDMTFPHQLMRIILLEQIYRGFKIINNETYHK